MTFKNIIPQNNSKRGMTLVELTVSISIFLVITLAILHFFLSGVNIQRHFMAKTDAINQSSYLMEYISRSVRMAKKDGIPRCIGKYENFKKTERGGLKFLTYDDHCQEFYLDAEEQALMMERDGVALRMTSPQIKVLAWSVYDNAAIDGWLQTDWLQPRVTISLELIDKTNSKFVMQTTVSQRNLDVEATD